MLSCKFCKAFKNAFFKELLRWMHLEIYSAHCAPQSFLTRRRLIQETAIHVKNFTGGLKKKNKKNKNNSSISYIFWNIRLKLWFVKVMG